MPMQMLYKKESVSVGHNVALKIASFQEFSYHFKAYQSKEYF